MSHPLDTGRSPTARAKEALAWLAGKGTKKNIEGLKRYGITATRPFGVTVGDLKAYAKRIGRDHELATKLWASGRYEARLLAIFVERPEHVSARQMDQWAAGFDNWALVDTACFHLFDRTAHAWKKPTAWASARDEFKKRAAFALLWSLSLHDKEAPDEHFRAGLRLIEKGADDDRNFVKKAVAMALRAIGQRSTALNADAVATAERLARKDGAAAWVGRDALRTLESPTARARVRKKA